MIPVLSVYGEYIDQRKLTEQNNPFEYIVPRPSSGVGTMNEEMLKTALWNGNEMLRNDKTYCLGNLAVVQKPYFILLNGQY